MLLWQLFNQTPLGIDIQEWVERDAARRCKVGWDEYRRLKAAYPDFWQRGAEKRAKAKLTGGFPPQPWQLRLYRHTEAKQRAVFRKDRPRFTEWAMKKLLRQRTYKRPWRRNMVLNRLIMRMMGVKDPFL